MADKSVLTISNISTVSTISSISSIIEEDWSSNYEICTNIHVCPHKEEETTNYIKPRIIAYNEVQIKSTAQPNVDKLKKMYGF